MLTRQDLNIALTANEDFHRTLHRQVITVSQALEREEYEEHMDRYDQEFMDSMRQGDNFEDSNV